MNSFFKTLIAGYGAKKLGGGCFSTILIFVLIYWLLGQCNPGAVGKTKDVPETQKAVFPSSATTP